MTGDETGVDAAGTATDVQRDDLPPAPGGPYAAWGRLLVWWHVAFWAVLALTALQIVLQGVRGRDLMVAGGAIGAIGVAYLVWGGPAARSRNQGKAVLQLAVTVVGVAAALTVTGDASFLLFVAFAQCWMLLESRLWSLVASVALAVAATCGTLARVGPDPEAVTSVPAQMGVSLVFAVGLGLWTAWTLRRAEEHARLVAELRDAQLALARSHHAAGVEAERARIAREIHDTLAQGFTSVVMQAQAASAVLDADGSDMVRDRLELIEETARDNLAEARALVAAFAPAPLKEKSLAEALGRLVARFGDETGLEAWFVADGVLGLPPSVEVVLLRVAQEGLANVRRHSGARLVEVRLARVEDTVLLEVSDDGRGLPEGVGIGTGEGFGLSGMRERVATAGGRLSIGPGRTGGTLLAAWLPLGDADHTGVRAGVPGVPEAAGTSTAPAREQPGAVPAAGPAGVPDAGTTERQSR
ncbi:sensor histidine kinase [Myceligenerans indicum]|uniref:histidine kinase n=1 Tax=Myceligenerans indicum TaxID=2593663 RepID=A0ABS1LND7_9MICO|nr:sensor histidine kinase [Myceligenerans indicum]MBL0887057.1 sensor histidine kinase [Myceligenerans indicum]